MSEGVLGTMGKTGHCAMRDSCGQKGWLGQQLPCPYDGPAIMPKDDNFRSLLISVCGDHYSKGPVCCTAAQVETLQSSLTQAYSLISSCPACSNNFRSFFCSFTCSPDQATFVNVTSTQETSSQKMAVKSVDFYVDPHFGAAFYDSCKDVKFGATNGYAMDLIGGGAKNYNSFLKFLGDEKPTGSPFQIDFPNPPLSQEIIPFNSTPRACSDPDLNSRCACVDCPSICQTLPFVPPPDSEPSCHVGALACLSFILIITYSIAVASTLIGYLLTSRRRSRTYERVALSGDTPSIIANSPPLHTRALIGASSLAQHVDGEESSPTQYSDHQSRHHLGRGASLLDPIETLQPRQYKLNTFLRRSFYRLGWNCASYPWLTFVFVFALIGFLNLGWKKFEVETDPVRLWVSPTSESKLQKEFFDQNFGPFYRAQQIFITADGSQDVLSWDRLNWWLKIESQIRNLESVPNAYTLEDVCFKPGGEEGACVVQSLAAWFGNDLGNYDEETWKDQLKSCAEQPGLVECLPDFQQPLTPQLVLGGVPDEGGDERWLQARSMVVTYVVSDSLDESRRARAEEWERALRDYLHHLSQTSQEDAGASIAFSTGVSLEEELNKSTNTDIATVVLSYLVMFFYVSLTLGNGSGAPEGEGLWLSLHSWVTHLPLLFKPKDPASDEHPRLFPRLPRRLFVGSKFTLGLFGIALVLLSISSSVGIFSFLGFKVTLIIAEVIPFLVLAVGVDNVFILVHELDRQNSLHGPNASSNRNPGVNAPMSPFAESSHDESMDAQSMPLHLPPEERVARTLAKMGPSILLSSITETTAFALGALVPMPAVRNFALYAAGAVLFDAILQVTVFISALALDLRRVEASRVDCFPCVKLPVRDTPPDGTSPPTSGKIALFIRRHYAPFLLQRRTKAIILALFGGLFITSVIFIQHIELGLDQRLALPSESYLIPYFDALDTYLDVGPPVYFVVRDVDVTSRKGQQAICGRFTTCDDYSVSNVLEAERKRPESSFISEPSAVWMDDFLRWLDPRLDMCCRVHKANPELFCSARDSERLCQPCYEGRTPPWNITMDGLPEGPEFMRYLQQWLISPTDENCPVAGEASFGSAIAINGDATGVAASHLRTFHAPLKSQADFINAMTAAHRIASDISRRTGADIFPYSLFYVFFDQYTHIVNITQEILGLGLGSVLVVTALLLGSWRTGTIVTAVVALTVTSVMGIMGIWGINLNALSLVNLVISLGIAVEFCSHVARAFMGAGTGYHPPGQKERDERMWNALVDVGPSVLSGITFTKLIGISVLALTRSRLLEIYYFRMWLTLIISGALHGLVLLPIVLSLAGGPGYSLEDGDEEWMSNAIRRHDYEYTPFLANDSDSGGSD